MQRNLADGDLSAQRNFVSRVLNGFAGDGYGKPVLVVYEDSKLLPGQRNQAGTAVKRGGTGRTCLMRQMKPMKLMKRDEAR